MKVSSEARKRMNFKAAWQKLELLLAANFDERDYHLVLTYDDEHLPADRDAARKAVKKFIVELRAYRKARGQTLKCIYNIEDKHDGARLHHHLVINGVGGDDAVFQELWRNGWHDASLVDVYHYDDLAKYFTKEPREYGQRDPGARSWVPTKNLEKPVQPPSEWVPDNLTVDAPPGATILEVSGPTRTEFSSYSFIKYLLPPIKVAERSSYIRKRKKE
ncbi:MAG: hypothetical protein RR949_08145 [Oscillospiraceae bacterium]